MSLLLLFSLSAAQECTDAGSRGLNTARFDKAQAWLDGIRYHVDWYRGRGIPPALVNWDSIELWPACGNFAPAELSTVRDRASEYILALKPADFNPQ